MSIVPTVPDHPRAEPAKDGTSPPLPRGPQRVTTLAPAALLRLLIPIGVALILWFVPPPPGVEQVAWHLFAIFVATIVGVIARPLPMGAVCLIAITAVILTGTLEPAEALSGFSNATIWLIVTAFLISRAVIKSGLGTRIALFFVSRIGSRVLGVSYAMAITDLILAPATPSNTARAGGVIMPILRSISSTYGSEPNSPTAKRAGAFFVLTAFQVNVVTSAMFLTAMAANPLAAQLAGDQGVTITWGTWALAAIVPGLISLLVVPALIYKVFPPEIKKTPEAAAQARTQLRGLGKLTAPEWAVVGTLVLLLLLWTVGDAALGLSATTSALVGLGVLLVVGALTWEDVKSEKAAWDTLVWFAALVMMATYLNELGLIPWLSDQMASVVGGMGWTTAFVILTLVYFFSHYLFASNTAHVSAMYAAFLGTAIAAGAPPLFAALVLGFISSLFASLTHYSSGPAPVLFGTGYVSLGEWWRYGLMIGVVNIAIWMGAGGAWMKLLGMW
ncbi:anion permease [Bogoriella caseilytica]|uniref:DASS family divalent anion:Na+ symporter n=1 Tax=Bogoriella caseilytica TaxID=56055 RepID=A0A3N2B9M2_9MICO|nr:anion permease [Bogoriella caseilytica]ROR71973.1 DASS family divalent anion:Na+ symporter [Bogoriella caseilytica]